jgi:hypothetical protein
MASRWYDNIKIDLKERAVECGLSQSDPAQGPVVKMPVKFWGPIKY